MGNEDLDLRKVIRGFSIGPLSMEDKAKGMASYMSVSPNVWVAVDRVEGSVAHFIQTVKIDDFENFRTRGSMGSPWRYETGHFEIDFSTGEFSFN